MAASVSPTAHLLRTSRLFSLPPPLKKATHTTGISSSIDAFSPTATLPYPSSAAIQTTAACSAHGDWGLKRPLPLKSTTKTTTPIIRVAAVDTIDHITDFESAADHAMSLRKWQELNLPIDVNVPASLVLDSRDARQAVRSVFESDLDNTYDQLQNRQRHVGRWKFRGPWLAGQTEGEFQEYVKTTIRRRRPAFRTFIQAWIENDMTKSDSQDAREEGRDKRQPVRLSNDEFEQALVDLRHQRTRLYDAIWEFLDLPGQAPRSDALARDLGSDFARQLAPSPSAELGPPATHPSAGLSYLRTAAHAANHALLGPQAVRRPVRSRVLRAQTSATPRHRHRPAVGVGGFVSDRPATATTFKPVVREAESGWNNLDPDARGGVKVWLYPGGARVDPRGRVRFVFRQAHANEVAVWAGQFDARWTAPDAPPKPPGEPTSLTDIIQHSPYRIEESKLGAPPPRRLSEGRQARLPERRPDAVENMDGILDGLMSQR